ncbi:MULTISPECIES: TetR/AcrR family transcriptional regulator [Nocardia]|uniref:TetR/AcrR family transcriptional regulator n=1 Tax=Nocardia TaxID=1817 RepID=UPI0002D4255E|nr:MULTISPECIES: TetR/AcrR family transcriptional regulator [Nocardia]
MPKLWNETVSAHRRAVRDALMDSTAELVAEHGLAAVTMTQIAETTGIGRATLYKYFPDVESILTAWHERRIGNHLEQLVAIASRAGSVRQRLEKVLDAYAMIDHTHHGGEVAAALHQGAHAVHAQRHVQALLRDLLAEAATAGHVRADVPAEELAQYCVSALSASNMLRSKAAVRRLVAVTVAGLRVPGAE